MNGASCLHRIYRVSSDIQLSDKKHTKNLQNALNTPYILISKAVTKLL